MGTRMLLFPGEEHLHRAPSSWGGMHDADMGNPPWMSAYSPSSSGGNTWSKRLAANNNNSHNHSSNHSDSDSWEVRAFAEDASTSGQWPPRSYSCSFCQREFRTAQALGGHMNVHRRERAQANQLAQLRSSTPGTDAHYPSTSPHGNPSTPHDHHLHHPWSLSRGGDSHVDDHQYGSMGNNPYDRYASPLEDSSYHHAPGASYGAPPSSPSFRNSSPYEYYRSPYDTTTPPRDCGLDLELRLGQRYD